MSCRFHELTEEIEKQQKQRRSLLGLMDLLMRAKQGR